MIIGFMAEDNSIIETKLMQSECELVIITPSNRANWDFFEETVNNYECQEIVVYNFKSFGMLFSQFEKALALLEQHQVSLRFLQRTLGLSSVAYQELLRELSGQQKQVQSTNAKKAIGNSSKLLGRPSINPDIQEKARQLRTNQQFSYRRIAAELDISIGSVHKYCRETSEEQYG